MKAVNNHPSSEKVSKHIEDSRARGVEMNRSLDRIIEHLRRAADALERANASRSKKT
jgi:hypothetical protein